MKYFYPVFLFFFISACQEDITPAWLEINEFDFTTNLTIEGENTHDIVDAWIYLDNKSLGVWELPLKIPVIEEGEHELKIFAGIKINGISATRTDYDFYESHVQTISLTKEQTTVVKPSFKYKSGVVFEARDDFEDTGSILNPDNGSDTTNLHIISKTAYPDIVKYGNNCAMLKLSKADSVLRVLTDLDIALPNGKIYLEMDYLSNNSFLLGILDETVAKSNDLGPYAGANPTDPDNFTWKKIYFDISEEVHRNLSSTHFEYYIGAKLDAGNTEGRIYIDNVKLVHF